MPERTKWIFAANPKYFCSNALPGIIFQPPPPSVLAGRHKSWRSQGGEEILEAVNAEYQKTKAKQ